MKSRLQRFLFGMATAALLCMVPLWNLWPRSRNASIQPEPPQEAAKQAVKVIPATDRLLTTAPSLSAGDWLALEASIMETPWESLRPILEARLAKFPTNQPDEIRRLLLIRWAKEDGLAAMLWTVERIGSNSSKPIPEQEDIAATWAMQDPKAFVAALDAGKLKGIISAKSYAALFCLAPADLFLAFEHGRGSHDIGSHSWGGGEPEIYDWTDGGEEMLTPYLKTPQEAKRLLDLILAEPHSKSSPPVSYVSEVMNVWWDFDPAGATAEMESNPTLQKDWSLKESVLKHRFTRVPLDEAAADLWRDSLRPKRLHDETRRSILETLAKQDVQLAIRWLEKQSPELRATATPYFVKKVLWWNPALGQEVQQRFQASSQQPPASVSEDSQ